MVNVGVVGLGMMGVMHINAYNKLDNARLVAICDQDAARASGDLSGAWSNLEMDDSNALDMSIIQGTTLLEEILAMDQVDLIDICVPTPFHQVVIQAALAAGKHVICEKPLALTSTAAAEVAKLVHESKGMFMPAMCMRFWPQWAWLKEVVAENRYGKVVSATFRRMASMPPGWYSQGQESGGALLDLHIHDTDFVCSLFGRPDGVYSRGYSKTSGAVDHITTQYIYSGKDSPSIVSAEGGWCLADGYGFTMRYTVNFEEATADFDIGREHQLLLHHAGQSDEIDLEGDGYTGELQYLINCIELGQQPERVTVDDATLCIQVIEAERKSLETGDVVKL